MPHDRGSSFVEYSLDGQFTTFTATAALSHRRYPGKAASSMGFKVFGDSKLLWQSRPLQQLGEGQDCRVDIRGVRLLRLQIDCSASKNDGMAVWINPLLTSRGESSNAGNERHNVEPFLRGTRQLHEYMAGTWLRQDGGSLVVQPDGAFVEAELDGTTDPKWQGRIAFSGDQVVILYNDVPKGASTYRIYNVVDANTVVRSDKEFIFTRQHP